MAGPPGDGTGGREGAPDSSACRDAAEGAGALTLGILGQKLLNVSTLCAESGQAAFRWGPASHAINVDGNLPMGGSVLPALQGDPGNDAQPLPQMVLGAERGAGVLVPRHGRKGCPWGDIDSRLILGIRCHFPTTIQQR